MINKLLVLGLVCPFAIGCSSKLVRMPGSMTSSKYAPVNEKSLPGAVGYWDEGVKPLREVRRKSAYKRMYNICAGRYKIVEESWEPEDGEKYKIIYFECAE